MIKNAIVVMFDSLQYNYLGCYGNTWIKTPNMDRLAREGIVFENNYTEGLPTVPCRRAMHTGRYTLPVAGWVPLSMEDTTIADLCWGRPIDTALIFDCPQYRLPKFGYTRGFDKVWFFHGHEGDHEFFHTDPIYHHSVSDYISEDFIKRAIAQYKGLGDINNPNSTLAQTQKYMMSEINCFLAQSQYWKTEEDQRVVRVMRKSIEYLEQVDRNKQFYLWVDSFDPHEPWDSPSVYDANLACPYDKDYKDKDIFMPIVGKVNQLYSEEELHHIRMLYAEKVTVCDKYFGELLDAIRRLGLEKNTLLMMVSDHGEPMGNKEHGHGIMRKCFPWPYEELAHAPMIIRGPGLPAGKRISSFTQTCDVAPTVCDWLGIGVHPDMQGKSLLPLMRGEIDKVHDFAIAGYSKFSWSIITEEWSYIHWLSQNAHSLESANDFYGRESRKDVAAGSSEALKRHIASSSTDGADQWTCTPGSTVTLPDNDELYCRKSDPFQLNNLITQEPKIAKELLQTLREFMSELKAS